MIDVDLSINVVSSILQEGIISSTQLASFILWNYGKHIILEMRAIIRVETTFISLDILGICIFK